MALAVDGSQTSLKRSLSGAVASIVRQNPVIPAQAGNQLVADTTLLQQNGAEAGFRIGNDFSVGFEHETTFPGIVKPWSVVLTPGPSSFCSRALDSRMRGNDEYFRVYPIPNPDTAMPAPNQE